MMGPMFWPTVNSYKRLVDGFWAPVKPTWAVDNRTASFRVIMGGGKSTRLETRCPGADMNPYLATAAVLAAGLDGIEKGTQVAGVFTKSKCPSAPVDWCRAKLNGGKARALVVNSGNANAFTGKTGRVATAFTAKLAARIQAEGGPELRYLGQFHFSRETGHAMHGADHQVLAAIPLTDVERVRCLDLSFRVFDLFADWSNELVNYARHALAQRDTSQVLYGRIA